MNSSIHFDEPQTRDEIIAAIQSVHAQSGALWRQFTTAEFFAPPPAGGWSPAQNVEHLVKSVAPLTMALGFPRLLLRALFGRARGPSRSYDELVAAYRTRLAAGAGAGSFSPQPVRLPDDPTAARKRLDERWQRLSVALVARIRRWDEPALDFYRLPHPLLGRLTLREMLFFSLYHLAHHAGVVAARPHESQRAQ